MGRDKALMVRSLYPRAGAPTGCPTHQATSGRACLSLSRGLICGEKGLCHKTGCSRAFASCLF